jgi:hypothetical protein
VDKTLEQITELVFMARYKKYKGDRKAICKSLGICIRTFNNWKNKYWDKQPILRKRFVARDFFGRPKIRQATPQG